MIRDFMQVKKEILKAASLEVGEGNPHVGGLGVPMNILIFLEKQKELFFRQSCTTFHD